MTEGKYKYRARCKEKIKKKNCEIDANACKLRNHFHDEITRAYHLS